MNAFTHDAPTEFHQRTGGVTTEGFLYAVLIIAAGVYFLYYRYHTKKDRVAKEDAEERERKKTVVDFMVEEKEMRKEEIVRKTGRLPPPSIMFNVHDLKPSFDASKLLPSNGDFVETTYHHRLLE